MAAHPAVCKGLVALLVEQLPGDLVGTGSIPGVGNIFSVACGCYSVRLRLSSMKFGNKGFQDKT